jgi:hypothetical protein
MKMTFENEYGIYTVEIHQVNLIAATVDEVIGWLIVPALRAAGYSDESIHKFIQVDECTDAFVETTLEKVHESR